MEKNILALDMGMQTGWASNTFEGKIGGSESFVKKPKSEGKSYAAYMKWLRNIIACMEINEIVIEDVAGRWRNKYAQRYWFAFRGITAMISEYYKIPMHSYHQMTIKKNVIGSGKADKDDIIAHYENKGILIIDDDHADALMLMDNHKLTTS